MRKAVRLVAQIHDELLFEANTKLCDVYMVAGELPFHEKCLCLAYNMCSASMGEPSSAHQTVF